MLLRRAAAGFALGVSAHHAASETRAAQKMDAIRKRNEQFK
jgi:hypothetical protein